MPKIEKTYVCNQCGHEEPRWMGKCPACGAWNSFEEFKRPARGVASSSAKLSRDRYGGMASSGPVDLSEVAVQDDLKRLSTGLAELDRVLGGGFVPGSMVLLGGEPGIGKSTLLLEVLFHLSGQGLKTLYVSGEESISQIKMRAERLRQGQIPSGLFLLTEVDINEIAKAVIDTSPDFIVVDSIQTIMAPELDSIPGTISQVRECTRRLIELVKSGPAPLALVGHVTKEGSIAGPRVLEHMVDAVLLFEGDRREGFRVLRAVKNRFGATFEVGVFEMTDTGLRDVANPSAYFLKMRPEPSSGSVIVPVMQGTRPILVEIQALVARSYLAVPRRTSIGIDANRLALMLAILEKRLNCPFFDKDVFVNVVGGIKIQETACDLALCLALVSSLRDTVIPEDLVVFGEVGLSGEVRTVAYWDLRVLEAGRLGFQKALLPTLEKTPAAITGCELIPVKGLEQALQHVF